MRGVFRTRRAASAFLSLAVGLLTAGVAEAAPGQTFDLRDWLQRPGVRAVAVEFYATWCRPCMRAVPRWKALHEKYRRSGLRLIVVNTQDPEGRCVNPGWNPDQMICDEEGDLAKAWGVGQRLPAAFVWSWQGRLLVRKGHVDQAARAVQRYLRQTPRVAVTAADPRAAAALPRLRERLADTGKLIVVAGKQERQALARIRKESKRLRYDQAQSCEAGSEVPANALLKSAVTGRRSRRLGLTLYSAESACALAATSVPWDSARPGTSVAEAVDKLLAKLRGALEIPNRPRGSRRVAVETDSRDTSAGQWNPGVDEMAMVSFASDPSGAMVMVDNKPVCRTPCNRALPAGHHRLAMHKLDYRSRDESTTLRDGQKLRWKLKPQFALLTVSTNPPGVAITLDGKTAAADKPLRVTPGVHKVVAGDGCHGEHRKKITLAVGDTRKLLLRPVPRVAGLRVRARDERGSDVRGAQVWINGSHIGPAFKALKVSLCAKEAEVRHESLGTTRATLSLVERKVLDLKVVLGRAAAPGEVSGGAELVDRNGIRFSLIPAGRFAMGAGPSQLNPATDQRPQHQVEISKPFYIGRTEVTQAQWVAVMGSNPSKFVNPQRPVEQVSWDDVQTFIRKLNSAEGKVVYRLPTEAEWERACRAGGKTSYHFGNEAGVLGKYAWYFRNSGGLFSSRATHPVARLRPNQWVLYDLHGNVWEWVQDWYGDKYYSNSPTKDPSGPAAGSTRVVRGGSWRDVAASARCSYRHNWLRYTRRANIGFRLVRNAP